MKLHFQKCTIKCLLIYTAILSVNIIWAHTCPPVVTTGVASIDNTAGIVGNKPKNEIMSRYNFSDSLAGKQSAIYYRIKPQEAYGQTFFSKVMTIQTVLRKDILDISPVPARRYTIIKWSSTNNSKLNITLFDVSGRFVLCRQYPVKKGENELLLTNLEALPAGIYFIKASDGTSYRNGKLRIRQ